MEQHVVAVVGSSPGVGKSTLCGALAAWLAGAGVAVDHFEEADVLTRDAFRPVAEEFADGAGSVRPDTLVAATRAYVAGARRAGVRVLVTDALLPFVPSLVAWGHDEAAIGRIVRELAAAVEPATVHVVYLRGAPEAALARAVAREGAGWERWYVDKLGRAPGGRSVRDLASAAEHLRWEAGLTARVLATTGWDVLTVDVDGCDAAETERQVRGRLREALGVG
ncbi:hypothetical protein SAMN06297387_10811 [Streptomyces zhaozhouensis]|uniref:AAA domain-containing protein n=1 Tax=Streptomyces zhaozhouensis TaxID=1300267 RepID=A0A286DW12_9ACTN|nr:hypothetical protein [Streptomyces zhaozhouensis]SOD62848.1 hypothetical protein SAMN06297387_10811 [Streptomyces zhaozhouensis]